MIDLRDYVQSRPKMINGPFYTYVEYILSAEIIRSVIICN